MTYRRLLESQADWDAEEAQERRETAAAKTAKEREEVAPPKAAPLFLNSADKSTPRRETREKRRQEAFSSYIVALGCLANREFDESDRLKAAGEVRWPLHHARGAAWWSTMLRVERCSEAQMIPYRCRNGHDFEIAPLGCGTRMCPRCEGKSAARSRERLDFLLGNFSNPVRMLTLTVLNRPAGGLAEMLRFLDGAFAHLRRSSLWRRNVRGAVAVFECTVSLERGWHAHIHVAWDGRFIPWEAMLAAWKKATKGQGQRIHMSGQRWAKAAAVRYLSKYVSKGIAIAELPKDMVEEFVLAWWKFRTLRTYGSLFRLKFEREGHDGLVRCPLCGEVGQPLAWVQSGNRGRGSAEQDRGRRSG